MSEPLYQFIKGEGWVITSTNRAYFTTTKGETWMVEQRKPNVGELWDLRGARTPEEYIEFHKSRGNLLKYDPRQYWGEFREVSYPYMEDAYLTISRVS